MNQEEDKIEESAEKLINSAVVSHQEQTFLQKFSAIFFDFLKMAILAVITIGLVRYFLFKPFYVKGQSMEPNFHENDYLIIDELSYRFRPPERGEVIVLHSPSNSDYYLKRVVGLPGERVKIDNNKIIIYNETHPEGVLVEEIYLDQKTTGSLVQTLGADEYFVLGDNRGASYDSRRFGPVKKEEIVGRAWLRGWPLNKITKFSIPNYNL
ncbi:MAG: signal peptidase I [Candidatus Magasanikbacteria bacterium GW2011_GWC2_37_14]|uniref:Signal peptidase I n=1 Tax=Candidatus Magasanikbacteria bacterium GW2011_GWC2_37_14 TaxID=1619046 RepID=A0A0G0GNC2_9BACT|nr:MAG: signal peptidase I [Candidatus Magasanikbacteria bacterium GW2011_GWC2_37_14]